MVGLWIGVYYRDFRKNVNEMDVQKITEKIHIIPMTENSTLNASGNFLNIYECVPRLTWANEREVERSYSDCDTRFGTHTVCWLITRGSVKIVNGKEEIPVSAGKWFFAGVEEGRQLFSRRAELISIWFQLRLRGGDSVFPRRHHLVLNSVHHPQLEAAARKLVAEMVPWGGDGSLIIGRGRIPLDVNFQIESAFYHWLSVYTRVMLDQGQEMNRARDRDERVTRALTLLEDHPMREPFSEKVLADECGLSVNQLTRLFKQELGVTPFVYFDRRRLELARHALADTGMQIKEIAFDLGFSSSPHFTNWFKDRVGMTPTGFR